jgi:hypothetical protein
VQTSAGRFFYAHDGQGQMAKKKRKAAADEQVSFRSRIKNFIPAYSTKDLKPHPNNWRLHPETQKDLLSGLLDRFGKIDAILAYESERYGGIVVIDGHQRQEMDAEYPVILLDVTDDEASEILMTYNPLAELATQDTEAYRNLLASVNADELQASRELAAIAQSVLGEQVVPDEETPVTLKRVEVKAPPQMIWVVVGIPINEFGSVNNIVEQLQIIPNVLVEMTPSDWKPPGK